MKPSNPEKKSVSVVLYKLVNEICPMAVREKVECWKAKERELGDKILSLQHDIDSQKSEWKEEVCRIELELKKKEEDISMLKNSNRRLYFESFNSYAICYKLQCSLAGKFVNIDIQELRESLENQPDFLPYSRWADFIDKFVKNN